jgi:DNA-binding transcriptional regulator YiaG
MSNGLFAESFRRAAARLGGVDELAIYLQTPVESVERWVRGTTRPPVSAFLRVVDIITSRTGPTNGR